MISSHNSDYIISFYNDRVKEIIDAGIMAEPFTYVPIIAGHMELVGGNALVFGKITEGYDVIEPNIVPLKVYEDVGAVVPDVSLFVTPFQTSSTMGVDPVAPCKEWETIIAVLAITLPSRVYEGSTYFVNVAISGVPSTLVAFYVVNPGDTLADVKAGLEVAMTLAGIEVVAGSPDNQIYIYEVTQKFCIDPYEPCSLALMFETLTVTAYISSFGFTTKYSQLKCGATHGFGIVYKDRAGRQSSVMKTSLLNVNIPFYTEDFAPAIDERVSITFKIYHKPPDWAETFEIIYFGNISMDYFLQMRIDDLVDLSSFGLTDHYGANIQQTIDATRDRNSRWKVGDYVWQEGDRIRFIGTIDDGLAGTGDLTVYAELYDYEIEEMGTAYGEAVGGDYLYFQAITPPAPFVGETNIIAEIYRPRKGLGITTPYGTGMVFGIGTDANDNRYHKGDVDQAISATGLVTAPAEVINKAHDCYKYQRLNYDHASAVIHPFWAESIQPSDWWQYIVSNQLTSNGFPFLDDLSQRQTVLDERFRFGGALITGTRTNNIAHFTYQNYRDLQKKNGDIIGMRETGYTLNIIQMYKETSIYINRIQTFNPDGTSQFTLTDTFIGDIRPLETSYGCQHPDSIMVNGRNIYYWDNSEGEFIRSAPNGQLALSGPEYKMMRWFKDLLKWINTHGGGDVLVVNIGANNDHDEIWITFRMGTEVTGLIFSEKQGRFVSRINQITESYIHLGNFFGHLYHQRLWIMNIDEGQDWLSWSGTPTYAEVEVVSNAEPTKNKVFNAVAVVADHLLQSLEKYVNIPKEASGCNELMESNVPVLDHREGIYFGKIMKDVNSKGVFASLFDRKNNGRGLRGRFCFVKFRTEEHDEKVRIDSITIFSTLSERNI